MKHLSVVIFCVLVVYVSATCAVKPNQKRLIADEPELIREVTNGQKFIIGNLSDIDGNYLYVAKLKGTPYEMGKAFGELF